MPGIDYQQLRAQVTIEQVLRLIPFHPSQQHGVALRGPCPIHDPSPSFDRSCFSVNLQRNMFRCFGCGAKGNQLDLWRLLCKRPLYEATCHLCQQLNIAPPRIMPSPRTRPSNSAPEPPRSETI